jgi:hypothetical protein
MLDLKIETLPGEEDFTEKSNIGVCSTPPSSSATDVVVEYEDLNVEHAQLLLFLKLSLIES